MRLNPYRRSRSPGIVSLDADLNRELIVNGTFDNDLGGWNAASPATIAWNAGTLRVSRNSAAIDVDMCYQDIQVIKGEWYSLKYDYVYESTGGASLLIEGSFDGGTTDIWIDNITVLKNENKTFFQAASNTLRLIFKVGDNTTATCGIDNVSLKRIIYHA